MNGHLETSTLSMYLDDALPAEQRGLVAHHLAACAHCTRRLADLTRLDAAVRSLPVPPMPEGLFMLADTAAGRRRHLGALIPLPARARQPVTGGGAPLQPGRPWWLAPTGALALAAGLLVVSVTLICRGYPSLGACADGWTGGAAWSLAGPPPPALATAIVRLEPPGGTDGVSLAQAPAAVATARAAAPPSTPDRGQLATPAAYPGPTDAPMSGPAPGPGGTAEARPGVATIAYPGPGQPVRAATQISPAGRKTQAAVVAGLATLAADDALWRVFLPRTDEDR